MDIGGSNLYQNIHILCTSALKALIGCFISVERRRQSDNSIDLLIVSILHPYCID